MEHQAHVIPPEATTTISYALREKSSKKLVRYETRDNSGGDCCHPEGFRLGCGIGFEEEKVYRLDSLSAMADALAEDTPWYNATFAHPQHGDINLDDFEIVKCVVVETQEVQAYEIPPQLTLCYTGAKPISILRRYSAEPALEATLRDFCVFELPEGETVETMQRFVRNTVLMYGGYYRVVLAAAFEVTAEYQGDDGDKPRFGAVTTDDRSFLGTSMPTLAL